MKGIIFRQEVWQAKCKVLEQYGEAMTRRVMNPQPHCACEGNHWEGLVIDWIGYKHSGKLAYFCQKCGSGLRSIDAWSGHGTLPRYQVGEVVYRKGAFCRSCQDEFHDDTVCYKSDTRNGLMPCVEGKWTSPLFLPAELARDFIQITAVRVERLQEITGEDAFAEGCGDIGIVPINTAMLATNTTTIEECHKELAVAQYASLWDSINKEYKWADNSWVWCYTFRRVARTEE